MADFNIFDHLSRQGGGFSGSQAKGPPSDGTNEKSTVDSAVEAGGKSAYTAARLIGTPVNLSEWGQHGLQKALGGDAEGVAAKNIPSMLSDAPGGFIARLLFDIFVKNREVTDHTQYVGGDGGGGAGSGGGDFTSGGGDFTMTGGGGFSDTSFMALGNFSDLTVSTGSFDYSDVSWSSLGNLPRPMLPDMSSGAAIEI